MQIVILMLKEVIIKTGTTQKKCFFVFAELSKYSFTLNSFWLLLGSVIGWKLQSSKKYSRLQTVYLLCTSFHVNLKESLWALRGCLLLTE